MFWVFGQKPEGLKIKSVSIEKTAGAENPRFLF